MKILAAFVFMFASMAILSKTSFAGIIHLNNGDQVAIDANTPTTVTCAVNGGTTGGRLYCYCEDGNYLQHVDFNVIAGAYSTHVDCINALRKEYLDICSRSRH